MESNILVLTSRLARCVDRSKSWEIGPCRYRSMSRLVKKWSIIVLCSSVRCSHNSLRHGTLSVDLIAKVWMFGMFADLLGGSPTNFHCKVSEHGLNYCSILKLQRWIPVVSLIRVEKEIATVLASARPLNHDLSNGANLATFRTCRLLGGTHWLDFPLYIKSPYLTRCSTGPWLSFPNVHHGRLGDASR